MNKLTLLLPVLLLLAACSNESTRTVELNWSEATELPQAITNNAVASAEVNGEHQLFTFLGLQRGKSFADVSTYSAAYNVEQDQWNQIPSVPDSIGRLGSTAQYANGSIYIFGGYTVAEDGSEESTAEVFRFDPESYTYEQVADMLIPVDDAVSLVYQDRYIYLVSGWTYTNSVSNVQVYDTETNSWQHATPYPGPPVFGHSGGIVGNTMVLSDGVQTKVDEGERIFLMSPGSIKGEISAEDPSQVTWTRIAQHPGNARYRMAAVGIESPVEMVVFIGGSSNPYNYNGIGYNNRPSFADSTVLAYRLDTEQWVELGTQPTPTMDHRGIVKAGEEYYIIGGMSGDQVVTPMVQKFTVDTGSGTP